jgi:hypothetical protein
VSVFALCGGYVVVIEGVCEYESECVNASKKILQVYNTIYIPGSIKFNNSLA